VRRQARYQQQPPSGRTSASPQHPPPKFNMSNRVAPEPSSDTAYFGVAKNFRKTHGEAAFMALATAAFTESDADGSGSIDKSELRGTLKKLGIRLPGQTDAILQYYDKDGNGTIEEAEFITLVSDLIDGTFATTLQPKLEAKMKQEQAQHAQQQQQAHLQQQAALQQTVLAQQAQLQQHSQVDQQRLAAENANLKATNNTLKEQVVALKKKVKQLERKTEDMEELNARKAKKEKEDAEMRAAAAASLAKMNDMSGGSSASLKKKAPPTEKLPSQADFAAQMAAQMEADATAKMAARKAAAAGGGGAKKKGGMLGGLF